MRHAVLCSVLAVGLCTLLASPAFGQQPPADSPGSGPAPQSSAAPEAPPPQPVVPPVAPAPVALPPVGDAPPASGPPASTGSYGTPDGYPTAGYHGSLFYLRDAGDNVRLHIQGRAQIDQFNYFGPGVSDTALKSTLVLRRIRPELSGELFQKWYFLIAGDWGITANDNPEGTNEVRAAQAGQSPTPQSARFAQAQTPSIRAQPTDVLLGYRAHPLLNAVAGQFDAPFTLENRTPDKFIPFMERPLTSRVVGIPSNKEMGVMLWGESVGHHVYYSAGAFNGDGQNRLSPDSRVDGMARAFVHPLASAEGAIKDLQIGGSVRYGHRDPTYVAYDYTPMTTQGGFQFWGPGYNNAQGRFTHVIPANRQMGLAGELRVPFSIFDVTSEVVYIDNGTREAIDGYEGRTADRLPFTERFGHLHGFTYYAQLGVWLGKRDINGLPGYENPSHIDFSKPTPPVAHAVQILVRWEQLRLTYDSASKGGTADPNNIDGDIKANVLGLGANYWAGRHVRLSVNYLFNMFPGSEPARASTVRPNAARQGADERAVAPGNTLPPTSDNTAREDAHSLHELLFRAAVAL